MSAVRVLAVGDPAVGVYTSGELGILARFERQFGHQAQFDVLPWDQYMTALTAACAAEQPVYDIVMLAGHLWLPEYAARGVLLPLDPWDPGDLLPTVDAEMHYEGVRYLVPSFSDGHILFSHVGLDDLIDPDTRCADPLRFDAAAERCAGRNPGGIVLKAAPSEIFLDWLPYLRAFGADFVDGDGAPLFLSPEAEEALRYYVGLRRHLSADHAPYGNEEVATALRTATTAFGVSWGGQAGVIVPPSGEIREGLSYATLTHPWNVTWSFGVLAHTREPEAARELLGWLSHPEQDRAVARFAGSPVRAATYADPAIRTACPWLAAQEELLQRAVPLPPLTDLAARMGLLYAAVAAAFEGSLTPRAALEQAAAAFPR